jgi:hypothetical protein
MAKTRNPKAIFGIFDYDIIPKLKRELRKHGLEMKIVRDRTNWGDQIEITFEPIEPPLVESRGSKGSAYLNTGRVGQTDT